MLAHNFRTDSFGRYLCEVIATVLFFKRLIFSVQTFKATNKLGNWKMGCDLNVLFV